MSVIPIPSPKFVDAEKRRFGWNFDPLGPFLSHVFEANSPFFSNIVLISKIGEGIVIPVFDFETPGGYQWLIERGLIGFVPFSSLQPWYYLRAEEVFDLSARWPDSSVKGRLIAFARRQDCDDLACFEVTSGPVSHIVLVHGWTSDGYEIVGTFASFWEWLKAVIDDVADWVEHSNS